MLDDMARIADLEAMGLIEIPKKPVPEARGNTGFRELGQTNNDDWLTA
jgi:hypothetical protein